MSTPGIDRVERLVRDIESAPESPTRAAALALIQAVLAMHGEGLQRIFAVLNKAGEPGRELTDLLLEDDLISSLLTLHDLHPDTLLTRVERAIEGVKETVLRHGADVQLRGVSDDGVVRVRLTGAGGFVSNRLYGAVEAAVLAAAPDAKQVAIEEESRNGFVPVTSLTSGNAG